MMSKQQQDTTQQAMTNGQLSATHERFGESMMVRFGRGEGILVSAQWSFDNHETRKYRWRQRGLHSFSSPFYSAKDLSQYIWSTKKEKNRGT